MPKKPDRDPFDGLVLDEAFIKAAKKREPSGDDRIARAASLRGHVSAKDAAARRARRPHRRAAARLRRLPAPLIAVVAVLAVTVWASWDAGNEPLWVGGEPTGGPAGGAQRPTPAPAASDTPLGRPVTPPAGGGSYRFIATQHGNAAPVAYDPCRPISVVVNERAMPDGAAGLLDAALEEVSAITGLTFTVEGASDETPTVGRAAFQPERYGDRWAPVLVAWSDPQEYPELEAAGAAGMAGSQRIETADGVEVYVTGIVVLNGPSLEAALHSELGRDVVMSVILHELGHLVGLDHVADDGQLMHPEGGDQFGFSDGDVAGLVQLGSGACIGEL